LYEDVFRMLRLSRPFAPLLLLLLAVAAPPGTVSRDGAGSAAPVQAEGAHLGERVNEFIDNLAAVSDRLLELPVYVQTIGLGIPAVILGVLIARFGRRRPRLVRVLVGGEVALVLLFLALLADRRIVRLQDEVRDLRARVNAAALAAPTVAAAPQAQVPMVPETTRPATAPAVAAVNAAVPPGAAALVAPAPQNLDVEKARLTLEPLFHGITLDAKPAGKAVTFVQLKADTPLVKAYVSIVDLSQPGVRVKINANLSLKTLTSTFARENHCAVAINGEAGSSPAMGAPLGPWTGHLMREGEVLLTEEPGNLRPFLSFDKAGRARFIPASATDRAVPSEAYNVIWGRWDVLVDSNVIAADYTRQPRTGMALSKDRTKLLLFVGDGRQPRNSVGFTRAEVGNILRALGAADGMLCDEGGSSAMYLASTNSIVNTPADQGGRERPVYTHFGVIVK
jgi:hypothetical protein